MKNFLKKLVEIIDTTLMVIGVVGLFAAVVIFICKLTV